MTLLARLRALTPGTWIASGIAAMLAVALAAVLATDTGAAENPAGRVAPTDRKAIEAIVREYILANPEIIPEAINRMQGKEVGKLLDSNRAEIETPFAGAWAGNPKGDVTLVAFFDFACPYCQEGARDVDAVLKADPNLRVVYRDLPVLSPASEEAAMAALSAARQGRYRAFHDRMFATPGRVGREKTVRIVRAAGLNERRTANDLDAPALKAEIKKNTELARALGLTGTPSYVVGDRVLAGLAGVEGLKRAIAEARAAKAADPA